MIFKIIQAGTLVGVGNLCFYSYTDILKALPEQYWKIISIKHKEIREITGNLNTHAEWEIIAEKI
ncbi:MAG: hypothetical protein RML38_04335 [Bacteroidia bacterium]|nr:hypothetical protein [Bacteroidia bacterium]